MATSKPWTYDTYTAIEDAEIALEMAEEAVRGAQRALREARRVHAAAQAVQKIEDRDEALDELADDVGYEMAEAIILCDRGPEEEPEAEPAPRGYDYEPDRVW